VLCSALSNRWGMSSRTSMYTEHLNRAPGAQHVCFYPADYDEALGHLRGTGMDVELAVGSRY